MQAVLVTDQDRPYDLPMQTGRPAKQPPCPFGKRLREAREARGLSQAQVAEQLGITQKAYSVWERRNVALRPEQIEQLARILGVSVEELFGKVPAQKTGPTGRVRRVFEDINRLSRHQQQKIADVVETLIAGQQNGRRNGH